MAETLHPGDIFGDYRVIRLLGRGGMGEVWLMESESGAQVAAKILDPKTANDEEARRRFLREAELAMGVKHPNLVETYDVGEDPESGLCYLLMEFVPGGSLNDRIKRIGPMPVEEALSIVYQIASVLERARQKGIVHRDIKPDNIMFGADGTAKLADLGIARRGHGADTMTITQTGAMIGTPAYMAPEQMLDSHHVDCRADIYSLGIVFYEMLTGVRPNKSDTIVEMMAKAMQGVPIPDVRQQHPEVSAAVAGLIGLMCAMNVDERVSTPLEVTTAISQIIHGRKLTVVPKRRPSVPQSQTKRRSESRPLIPLLIVSILAAVAVGGWYKWGRTVKPAEGRTVQTRTGSVYEVKQADGLAPFPVEAPARTNTPGKTAMEPIRERAAVPTAAVRVSETNVIPPRPVEKSVPIVRQPAIVTNGPPIVLRLGEGVTLRLVKCPAGAFSMGYADSTWPSHAPMEVRITHPFWIGEVPVTIAQWQRLMGEYPLKETDRLFGHLNLAVGRITDIQMLQFCGVLTRQFGNHLPKGYVFRLPTDAEWEYACKAGSSDSADPYVRYRYTALSQEQAISVKRQDMNAFYQAKGMAQKSVLDYLWPVGTKKPNRWGIYDMIGLGGELLFDTYSGFDTQTGSARANHSEAKTGCGPQRAEDPVSICTEPGFVRLTRSAPFRGQTGSGAPKRWSAQHSRLGVLTFRIVAGPDIPIDAGVESVRRREQASTAEAKPRAVPKQGKPRTFSLGKKVDFEFVNCPAGTFTMGWPCANVQHQPHEVTISREFWGSRYPVTREQWNRLMPPKPMTLQERVLGGERGAQSNVTCAEIDEFCQQLTRKFRHQIPRGYVFRLPTMAEYQYMWRAGGVVMSGLYGAPEGLSDDERKRLGLGPEGKRQILIAEGCDLSDKDWTIPAVQPTAEVGRGEANAWGMYDFSGNGECFVLDCFPEDCLKGQKWGIKEANDLKWPEREKDPLFWCESQNVARLFVMGRNCRAWGVPWIKDKIYCRNETHCKCILFRLVVGPDLVKERKRRKK